MHTLESRAHLRCDLALLEVLTLMQNQADAFMLPRADFGMAGFDPLRDPLAPPHSNARPEYPRSVTSGATGTWRFLVVRPDGSRVELENDGAADELVISDWFHIEAMDEGRWWLPAQPTITPAASVAPATSHLPPPSGRPVPKHK